MVVDDDPSIVKSWKRILRLNGYAVVTASNGREGLAAASKESPALIITDQSRPAMDGVEFCRRLKLERALARIPIILISANPPAADRKPLWDEFLFKPVLMDVLLASVQRLLKPGTGSHDTED